MKLITALYDIFSVIAAAVVVSIPILCFTIFSVTIHKDSLNMFNNNIFLKTTSAGANYYYVGIDVNLLLVISSLTVLVTVILGIIDNSDKVKKYSSKIFLFTMDMIIVVMMILIIIASTVISSDYREIISETTRVLVLSEINEYGVNDYISSALTYNTVNASIRDSFLIELFILISLRIIINYNKRIAGRRIMNTDELQVVDTVTNITKLGESVDVIENEKPINIEDILKIPKETIVVNEINVIKEINES